MDLSSLRTTLFRLLPTLLIALILTGNAMFCALVVLPQWRAVDALTRDLSAGQATAAAQASMTPEDETSFIQSQLEKVEQDRATAAAVLVADRQLDDILNDLYAFARDHDVTVSSLQAQQSVISPDGKQAEAPYETRQFRVRVEGKTSNLIAYITELRETALRSFVISNLALVDANPRSNMTFDIQVYLSPYAGGEALVSLITTVEAVPTVAPVTLASADTAATEEAAILAAGSTAASTVNAQGQSVITDIVASAYAGTNVGANTPGNTNADSSGTPPSAIMPVDCPGTAAPRFSVGEIVVVDFNDSGALRVMESVTGGAGTTLMQIYDNEILHLLAGPVCGKWNETNIWYWYVNVQDVQGWVGEGTVTDRWLCPLSNPECAGAG